MTAAICDCGRPVACTGRGAGACASCLALDGEGPVQGEVISLLIGGPMTLRQIQRALGIKYQSQILRTAQALRRRGRVEQVNDPDLEGSEERTWRLTDPARQARRRAS